MADYFTHERDTVCKDGIRSVKLVVPRSGGGAPYHEKGIVTYEDGTVLEMSLEFAKALRDSLGDKEVGDDFFRHMVDAPWDEYVVIKVESGVRDPQYDQVVCMRRQHTTAWITVHNNHLTDSHTGRVVGWKPLRGNE